MNAKIQELINFLEEEIKIYQKVLKLSKEKTDIITKDKRAELEELINELGLENIFGKKVSIFEVLASNFIKAKSAYNVDINWYMMLSNENKYETVKFFVDNNYFGLPKHSVKFFMQNDVPLIDENGKVVVGKDFLIKTASNGNGGVYEVLESEVLQAEDLEASDEFSFRKSKNGKENRPLFQDFQESRPIFQQDFQEVLGVNNTVLDDMKNRNIEWIFVSGVDNILVNPIDPLFIGLTIKEGNLIASKTVKKTDANEKTGVFAKKNGKIGVIEYNEISEELRNAKDDDGELVYGQSNIVSHLYNIEALEEFLFNCADFEVEPKKAVTFARWDEMTSVCKF